MSCQLPHRSQSTKMTSSNSLSASTTPISQLISTWTDLDVLVDAEDGLIPIDATRSIQRPLRDVKRRFESPDPLFKLVCPRLLPTTVPSCVIELNEPRNNKAEVRHRFLEDRRSIARQVLAQKGALHTSRYREADCWIQVEQGGALLTIQGRLNTAEERAAFDSNPGPGSFGPHESVMPLSLIPGQLAIIPALSVFFIAFDEDTLMFMGDIVPFAARRDVDPNRPATRAADAGRTDETVTETDDAAEEDLVVIRAGTTRKERRELAKQEKKEAKKAKKVSGGN